MLEAGAFCLVMFGREVASHDRDVTRKSGCCHRPSKWRAVIRRQPDEVRFGPGVTVCYEAIRQWCRTFGPAYARTLRRRRGRMGDTWYLDELFVNIQRRQQYLWRAVDSLGKEDG